MIKQFLSIKPEGFLSFFSILLTQQALAVPLNVDSNESIYISYSQTLVADGISTNAGYINNEGFLNTAGLFNNTGIIFNYNNIYNSGNFTNAGNIYDSYGNTTLTNASTGIFTNTNYIQSTNIVNAGIWNEQSSPSQFQQLINSGTLNADSDIYINDNSTLINAGSLYINAGLSNSGSFIGQSGSHIENSSNSYIYSDGTFSSGGSFINNGSLTTYSTFSTNGLFTNNGYINGDNYGNSFLSNGAAGILDNSGTIYGVDIVNAGIFYNNGDLTFNTTFTNTGVLGGTYGINVNFDQILNNSGLITVDGGLSVDGTYNGQSSSSIINNSSVYISNQSDFNSSGSFHNFATINLDGTMVTDGSFINDGSIYGYYTDTKLTNGNGGTLTNNGYIDVEQLVNAGVLNDSSGISIRTLFTNTGIFNATYDIGGNSYLSINNSGVMNFQSGLSNDGVLNNQPAGSINNQGAFFNEGELTSSGLIRNDSNGTMNNLSNGNFVIDGALTNDGIFENQATLIIAENSIFQGAGTFFQSDGLAIINGHLSQNEVFINGGAIQGNGSVSSASGAINIDGVAVNPGNSVGSISFEGSTEFNSTLNIEIESLVAFDTIFFDQVNFGTETTFNFLLDALYNPIEGDLVEFLFAETITDFDAIDFTVSGGTNGLGYSLLNSGSSISLQFMNAVPIPAAAWLFGSALLITLIPSRLTRKNRNA